MQPDSSGFPKRTNNIHLSSLSHRFPGSWSRWEQKASFCTSCGQVRVQRKETTFISNLVLEGGLTALEKKNWQLTHQRVEHVCFYCCYFTSWPSPQLFSQQQIWQMSDNESPDSAKNRLLLELHKSQSSQSTCLATLKGCCTFSPLIIFFLNRASRVRMGQFQKHKLWSASLLSFSSLPFPHYCSLHSRLHILKFDKWQINPGVQRMTVELGSLPQPYQTVCQLIFQQKIRKKFSTTACIHTPQHIKDTHT